MSVARVGVPFGLPAGDTNSDGDSADARVINFSPAYDIRKDAELDDDIDAADVTYANSITGGYACRSAPRELGRVGWLHVNLDRAKGVC